jgi:hypothetical protein
MVVKIVLSNELKQTDFRFGCRQISGFIDFRCTRRTPRQKRNVRYFFGSAQRKSLERPRS